MSTYTASSQDFMRPYRLGSDREFRHYPEGASCTFRLGAVLVLSTVSSYQNYVVESTNDPTTGVVGLAGNAASGVTGTDVTVWNADSESEFSGIIADGLTVAATDLGLQCSIVYDTTNTIWRVDKSDTGNKVVTITSLIDSVGTVNGHVGFQFASGVRSIYRG